MLDHSLMPSYPAGLGYLSSSVSVEPLVRVSNERQAHLRRRFFALLCRLRTQRCACVVLVDLVNGEVLRVDVGLKLRLKWCTDAA